MAGALVALGPAGERLELRVDATGALLVAGGTGGGGGAGDASAANQLTQITREAEIRDRIILPAALDADGGLKSHIQNFPATQPVSGTVALDAATLAALESITATIANWPAVQPVSDNGGSLTVDGTFWQATQPVSGPLTDAQLRAAAVPVSGTFWQATQPVSGPLTDAQLRATPVPIKAGGAATSAVTNVASSATSVTLKAANANRLALYIYNAGTSALFAKLGATATTTTSYTFSIPPGGFWELPDDPIYTGVVDGIWTATGGNGALVTELT